MKISSKMAGRLLSSQLFVIAENRGAAYLFRRILPRKVPEQCQSLSTTAARCAQKKDESSEEQDPGPMKFSTSKGAQWKVEQTMLLNKNQPLRKVATVSLTFMVILLYFCVFRKESWLDQELEKSLYARMPGLLPEEEDGDEENNSVASEQEMATAPATS